MDRKAALLNALIPVKRGLTIDESQRRAIFSAITYLEEQNPYPVPTAAPQILSGNWRMLFTTSQSLLGFDRFPGITLGEIYQSVNVDKGQIYNVAELNSLPFLGWIVSVGASFTIASAQRINVRFNRSVVGLQSLLGYQSIDRFIARLEQHDRLTALDVGIKGSGKAWLDITYLDADLRIGRGNEGNVFVLQKRKSLG